jgi:hypothetical protein
MEILIELAKRGGGYARSARQAKSAARRDRYLELAAQCFSTAAKRAESLIGQDIADVLASSRDESAKRFVC